MLDKKGSDDPFITCHLLWLMVIFGPSILGHLLMSQGHLQCIPGPGPFISLLIYY